MGDLKIGSPFRRHDQRALDLLYLLIDNVMIRHSKGQSYSDGRPLVKMPPRTVEWRPFEISNSCGELYLIKSLEIFMADALERFMVNAGDSSDGNSITRVENYPQVRSLLGLFSRLVSHPSAIALGSLD